MGSLLGFVVDKMELGQIFYRILQFSHMRHHSPVPSIHLSVIQDWYKDQLAAAVKTDWVTSYNKSEREKLVTLVNLYVLA
jgi:hypothetical protein